MASGRKAYNSFIQHRSLDLNRVALRSDLDVIDIGRGALGGLAADPRRGSNSFFALVIAPAIAFEASRAGPRARVRALFGRPR